MTSGLSGSPTDKILFSDDKSYLSIISSPALINILNAVGAVYHIVTLYSSIIPYQASGENLPPTIQFVTPFNQGLKIPYEVPVTHPGSAVHQYTSSSLKSSTYLPEM